jgi:hypothetical protein
VTDLALHVGSRLISGAHLGQMTRSMPGGDGSLEWALYGEDVVAARNALTPGAAVRLYADGSPVWGGRLLSDPLRYRATSPDAIDCAAGGLHTWAARRQDAGYVVLDADPTQWFRLRQRYSSGDGELINAIDQGKFTVDTEGRLFIRADADRSFAAYSNTYLVYWLGSGLLGDGIYGLDIEYKCALPSDWRVTVRGGDADPWNVAGNTTYALALEETADRAAWHTESIDFAAPVQSVAIALNWNNGASGTGWAEDPYVNIRSVTVYGRSAGGGAADRTVTIDTILGDLATRTGLATVTDLSTIGTDVAHFALRPELPKTTADLLREAAASHDSEVEYGFDLDASGADRFWCCPLPVSVNAARNRHWSFGGEDGEDTTGLVRDVEAAPDYIRLLHLSSGVGTLPNSQVRSCWYPSEPSDWTAAAEAVTDYADVPMTDAEAADLAERIWTRRQAGQWTGSITFKTAATDLAGHVIAAYHVRPGDRVHVPGLDGAHDLYIAETSYDWQTGECEATIGWPFEAVARVEPTGRPLHGNVEGPSQPWSPH